jgi:NAD(P)-dependent dehydrogenase (short-subunit alcohol dehydrogenase family)
MTSYRSISQEGDTCHPPDFAKRPKPEDTARVIVFLCSDSANVIHGAAIPVFGNE